MLLRKKEEIEAWLNKYHIYRYDIIKDKKYGYVVNVDGNVDLAFVNLKQIEIKFNKVNGFFDCSENELESLEGSPEIVTGSFFCYRNKLTTLENVPLNIGVVLNCSNNQITTLKDCSNMKCNWLNCNNNKLSIEGLKYLPKEIKENYIEIEINEKLGELQKIKDFNKLKENVKILLERENLLNNINKEPLNKNKNKI